MPNKAGFTPFNLTHYNFHSIISTRIYKCKYIINGMSNKITLGLELTAEDEMKKYKRKIKPEKMENC